MSRDTVRLTEHGELGVARDFRSYGAQMDDALGQKLADLLPWVVPGRIVDKGCGTGRLLFELAARFPRSSFVGVDLSGELLRMCAGLQLAADDVSFVRGNVIERQVEAGTATTIVFSSVMHEVYTYSDYSLAAIDRALDNAVAELAPGGQLLIRDGVSPGPGPVWMRLVDAATRACFERFAVEFKRGSGAAHERRFDGEHDWIVLSAHLANEFLCKKDYQRHWHLEVHEEFGPLTVESWCDKLSARGLEVAHAHAYVNPWIAEHRYAGAVELRDDAGRPLPWPATNVVVVGRKAGRTG